MKVYYCDISGQNIKNIDYNEFCLSRKLYVDTITDDKRKLQSVAVWKLLLYATKYTDIDIICSENGKWHDKSGKLFFSISHSANFVVVALSAKPIGIDVEMCNEKIIKIKRRFDFTLDNSLSLTDNLTLQWTKEESEYKAGIKGKHYFKKIKDSLSNEYYVTACGIDDKCVFLSTTAEDVLK